MIDALVTGATAIPGRGLIVRVPALVPADALHWLLGGHTDVQAPSCGTPSQYLIAATGRITTQ